MVAYVTNGYNNDAIKVECTSEEEFQYWRRVLNRIEDTLGESIYLTREEDTEPEELCGDIYEVQR